MSRGGLISAALIVVLLGLQVRLWSGTGSYAEVADLEGRAELRRNENRRLSEHNALLEEEVLTLKRSPEHLEARARSELGMIREGETFYMIVPRGGVARVEP